MANSEQKPPRTRGRRPLATTPEEDERRLVSLARDLVEERLRKGTATSQEIVHFLRMGSTQHKLEQEKLRNENLLLQVKVESIASGQRTEELYENAINAMKRYTGHGEEHEYED